MMICRTLAVLLTAATVIAAPEIVAAQPAPSQGTARGADEVKRADDVKRADASYRKGLRLYTDGKYAEAEKELQSAWELNPTYDVAYNLGLTKFQLKKHKEAAQHLSFALRHWPLMKAAAEKRPEAEQRLAVSRAHVGAVIVVVGVAGAEVVVDGTAVGKTPLEGAVFVDPGEHRVEARLPGYESASQTVSVAKGGTAEVTLAMALAKSEPQAAAPGPKAGEGASTPGAGAGAGAPLAEMPPAAPPSAQQQPPHRSWVPVIALGAASAVGLGVGIGMTVAGSNVLDDVHSQRQAIRDAGGQCARPPAAFVDRCAELNSAGERVDTLGHVAGAAYVASGVLAAAALTYALWPRDEAGIAGQPRVVATAHPMGAGIVVLGAW
ncbi:PEGA domain-containing protein [Sorangium sp. So ce1389]|uniref:PEGA domain-containing protein n=1 Tax=Sorangium sp. So ce1389 TaxID=3133336 RepID=UPI003F639B48